MLGSKRDAQHHTSALWAALVLFWCCALAGCNIFREPLPTPRPTTIARVTADEVAQAMDEDRFYATYGQTALLIEGSVASVDPQPNHFVVTLATSVRTKVLCDLGKRAPPIKVGDRITVRSADPEQDVSRQDAAVMIQNCAVP